MRSSNRRARNWRLTVALVATVSLAVGAAAADGPASQCRADESVLFSCHVGPKVVSLCATRKSGEIETLAYRYGLPGNVENEYLATRRNGNRFLGNVSPASPGASIRQIWFASGDIKSLLTECVGGDCSQSAGLAVFRGDQILSNARCSRTGDDLAWFSSAMVNFGSDIDSSKSKTDLLRLEDVDNEIEKIYGAPRDDAR